MKGLRCCAINNPYFTLTLLCSHFFSRLPCCATFFFFLAPALLCYYPTLRLPCCALFFCALTLLRFRFFYYALILLLLLCPYFSAHLPCCTVIFPRTSEVCHTSLSQLGAASSNISNKPLLHAHNYKGHTWDRPVSSSAVLFFGLIADYARFHSNLSRCAAHRSGAGTRLVRTYL